MRVKHMIKVTIALTHDETDSLARLLNRVCDNTDLMGITQREIKIASDMQEALYSNVPHIN